MKSKEEIEQLAENSSYNNSEHFEDYQDGMFYGYIKGYTQCQEDMADKDKRIKELEEVAIELFNLVHDSDLIQNKIRANDLYDIINSLNKQD